MTPFEVMAAAESCQTMQSEFGRPKPSFVEDELAATQKALAEQQARAMELAARTLKRDLA